MGIDPETPVGFQHIRTSVRFDADATLITWRLAARAERYCVVGATLREGTVYRPISLPGSGRRPEQ